MYRESDSLFFSPCGIFYEEVHFSNKLKYRYYIFNCFQSTYLFPCGKPTIFFFPILLLFTFLLPQKITTCPAPPPLPQKKEGGRKYRVLSSKVKYRNTKRGMLVLQNPEVQVTGTVLFATWNTAKKIHGMHRLCLAKTQESKVSVSCSLHSHWKTITKVHNHNSFNSTVQLVWKNISH